MYMIADVLAVCLTGGSRYVVREYDLVRQVIMERIHEAEAANKAQIHSTATGKQTDDGFFIGNAMGRGAGRGFPGAGGNGGCAIFHHTFSIKWFAVSQMPLKHCTALFAFLWARAGGAWRNLALHGGSFRHRGAISSAP